MSSNLKVNSLVPATGTEIGIGTTGGSIDFRCPCLLYTSDAADE